MPELLIVIGIVMLLIAITVPPLHRARRQALNTRCKVQLQQIGISLENVLGEYEYYPLWDDGGSPVRFTWIDVLIQLGALPNVDAGYCPEDPQPAALNAARAAQQNVLYPGNEHRPGLDYSYGIGVPLSAGAWNRTFSSQSEPGRRPRRFENHDRHTAQRVLAGDANWSTIYNLSGDALLSHAWNYPTQYDNTVAWRHAAYSANLLFQDGHVARRSFQFDARESVNTSLACLWYPGEPVNVGPEYQFEGNWYPDVPPVDLQSGDFSTGAMPREVIPGYYTHTRGWTQIYHK